MSYTIPEHTPDVESNSEIPGVEALAYDLFDLPEGLNPVHTLHQRKATLLLVRSRLHDLYGDVLHVRIDTSHQFKDHWGCFVRARAGKVLYVRLFHHQRDNLYQWRGCLGPLPNYHQGEDLCPPFEDYDWQSNVNLIEMIQDHLRNLQDDDRLDGSPMPPII
jgi:hypothetical protein